MNKLKFKCMKSKCGVCCYEVPKTLDSPSYKRIPLYPEEVDKLILFAQQRKIDFKVIEDIVFPDVLNQKILVVCYRILLDNNDTCCPFFDKDISCTIHDSKPMACQAYPLALKRIDAFNYEITIDCLCNFVLSFYNELSNIDVNTLKNIFDKEYPKAEKFFRKNKRLMLKIREMEYEKKIKIPQKITVEEFKTYLNNWERSEIRVE